MAQLRAGLEKRRFSPDDVRRVILKFRSLGLLDDLRAAAEYLRSRSEGYLLGGRRLVRDLRRAGIPETVIRKALVQFRHEVNEREVLVRAFRRKLRTQGPPASAAEARRLYQYLLRKGFEPEAIREVVRPHLPEEEPAERGGEEGEGE